MERSVMNILEEAAEAGDASKLDVGSLKLVGIIDLGDRGLRAMLEDSDNNTIFLHLYQLCHVAGEAG